MACACKNKGGSTPSSFGVTKNVSPSGVINTGNFASSRNDVSRSGIRRIVRRDFR